MTDLFTSSTEVDASRKIIRDWIDEACAWSTFKMGSLPGEYTSWLGAYEWEIHRSSFQKCMRRGLPELALYHFQKMAEVEDYTKAFGVLALVAGEDIGFPALEMTALSLMMCLKTFRQAIGIDEQIIAKGLIYRLCRSPKNRLGCQLNVFVDVKGIDQTSIETPDNKLIAALADKHLEDQFIGLRMLRKKCRNGNVELLKKVIRILKDSFLTKSMGLAASIIFERANDDIHFGQVIVTQMMLGGKIAPVTDVPNSTLVETHMIQNSGGVYTTIPQCALDQHTTIGRSALLRWAKTNGMQELFQPFGINNGDIQKALGAITFFRDASLVQPELGINDDEINKLIVDQELSYTMSRSGIKGLTEETYSKLSWTVMEDLSTLYDLRQYLWKKDN
ncbi:hypothetical protein EVB27_120 [Rhizobium phage RHph_TM16]|nr:hypothetical protein EVB27_120 [Rhizobium phage RHph_TM16]